MDSDATILAVHNLNDNMWETTNDNNISLLFVKEDLVCCQFDTPHLEESDNEYDVMLKLKQISNSPMIKTVEEEHAEKFVFYNAEELFPSINIEPILQPTVHNTKPVLETPDVESSTSM